MTDSLALLDTVAGLLKSSTGLGAATAMNLLMQGFLPSLPAGAPPSRLT